MAPEKTNIWVYADWIGMKEPLSIGILSAQRAKGRWEVIADELKISRRARGLMERAFKP